MYEQRFGFKSNPFRKALKGPAVFVGPQQAKVISALQKALSGTDNIVAVSGPAGVGKTTIVTRALEMNKAHQLVAWIGRMRLAPDEVMELLLAGFGVSRQPTSMVQKFSAFQRILNERAKKNIRVVVVIEDALRIGNDALLELEALTAADTGITGGANLILMGPPEIDRRLQFPELGRLKQRCRLGQKITPFNEAETRGYLKHCLRAAEVEFDSVFEQDAANMIFRCSEGVPRVINSLCDSALGAAFERKLKLVDADLIQNIAQDVYGIDPLPTATPEKSRVPEILSPPDDDDSTDCDVEITETALIVAGHDRSAVESPPKSPASRDKESRNAKAQDPSEFDIDATLPPVVAHLITNGSHVSTAAKTAVNTDAGDTNIELPDLSDIDDQYDVADDALIADTGMNVPPQFRPDPELDIQPSQLVSKSAKPVSAPAEEDLPTLAPEAETTRERKIEAESVRSKSDDLDDSDLPILDTVIDDEFASADGGGRDLDATATDLPALNRIKDADVPVLKSAAAASKFDDLPATPTTRAAEPKRSESSNAAKPALASKVSATQDELPVTRTTKVAEPKRSDSSKAAIPAQTSEVVPAVATKKKVAETLDDSQIMKVIPDLDALEAAISAARRADPLADAGDDTPRTGAKLRNGERPTGKPDAGKQGSDEKEKSSSAKASSVPASVIVPEAAVELPVKVDAKVAETGHDEPVFDDVMFDESAFAEPPADVDVAKTASSASAMVPVITLDQILEDQRKEGSKLDQMAAELAKASSLEDISDIMAETLFGEDFTSFAAEALLKHGNQTDAVTNHDVIATPLSNADQPVESPANDSINEESPLALSLEETISSIPAESITEVIMETEPPVVQKVHPGRPDSIDDQFQTSITQTLKALSISNTTEVPEPDDRAQKGGGFFGKLKRSLKGQT